MNMSYHGERKGSHGTQPQRHPPTAIRGRRRPQPNKRDLVIIPTPTETEAQSDE
jgi:hypothetical protein